MYFLVPKGPTFVIQSTTYEFVCGMGRFVRLVLSLGLQVLLQYDYLARGRKPRTPSHSQHAAGRLTRQVVRSVPETAGNTWH